MNPRIDNSERPTPDWQITPVRPLVTGQPMRYADYGIDVPFLDHLEIFLLPMESGEIQLIVDLQHKHMNGGMVTHGGMVMTLLDMAMALAGRRGDPQQRVCVTVEMKSNFLRPAGVQGNRLLAQGTLRHNTRSLAFCDGELRDQGGALLATASGTFKYTKQTSPAVHA